MTPAEIIDEVQRYGGRIEASGDRLNLRAPEPLPGELMERIRQHKAEVLRALTDAETEQAYREAVAERAAIQEIDGGLSRQEAESQAKQATRVYRFNLADDPGLWPTLLWHHGDGAEDHLRKIYGDRLLEVRRIR